MPPSSRQQVAYSVESPQQLELYGRQGGRHLLSVRQPTDRQPAQRQHSSPSYEDALEMFCSFLCGTEDDRQGMSNLLWLWDSLPIWSCEQANRKKEIPELETRRMTFEGQELEIMIVPGTFEKKCSVSGKNTGKRMYPGQVEMMVEHAIIKLACDKVYASEKEGRQTPVYSVSFSLRQIRSVMDSLGSGITHRRLREALDILSTTSVTIRDANPDGNGKRRTRREAILPGFARLEDVHDNETDQWKVDLHPLVAQGINEATYRQYRLDKLRRLAPYGVYMLRQMLLTCHTLSPEHPYRVMFSELREMSSGLNSARIADSIYRVERELQKMRDERIIADYRIDRDYALSPNAKRGGRPRLTDAEFVLIPTSETVSEVKAASKRQLHIEQTLQLARSKRTERRQSALDAYLSQPSQSAGPVRTEG